MKRAVSTLFISMIVASVATLGSNGRALAASITTLASFDYFTNGSPVFDGGSGVVVDSQGNLFGNNYGPPGTDGTVYELAAGSNTITPLAFFNGSNGATPSYTPVLDAQGNLYGTTAAGGANGVGTVYELAAGSNTITALASFSAASAGTLGGVVVDAHGDIFGTTQAGGAYPGGGGYGLGTVFEIVAGSHTMTTLASFNGNTTGEFPYGNLFLDGQGNLYGLAGTIGTGYSRVYEIAAGSNTITTLATFDSSNNYGALPMAWWSTLMETSTVRLNQYRSAAPAPARFTRSRPVPIRSPPSLLSTAPRPVFTPTGA